MKSIAIVSTILFLVTPAFGSNLSKQDINKAYTVEFNDGRILDQIAWIPVINGNNVTYTVCDKETDMCFKVTNSIDEAFLYKIDPENFVD